MKDYKHIKPSESLEEKILASIVFIIFLLTMVTITGCEPSCEAKGGKLVITGWQPRYDPALKIMVIEDVKKCVIEAKK